MYSLLPITFFFNTLYAQKVDFKYNEHLWKEITLAQQHAVPEISDTMLVICTVRVFDSLAVRIFSDKVNTDNCINYLLAVRKNDHWTLYRKNSLDEAASFLKSNKDVVFYIEGMGKTFTTNLYRGAGLTVQYDVNTILFDYPSADPAYGLLHNFRFARKNSSAVYKQYAIWLRTIQKSKKDHMPWIHTGNNTTLFHHSMGNRMLEKAITSGSLSDMHDPLVHTLVLNASCVRSKNHNQWISKINFADEVIVTYNKQDRQLKGAGIYTFCHQLGCSPYLPIASNVKYLDLNKIAGKQHNLFLNRPGTVGIPLTLHQFYRDVFHNPSIDWLNKDIFYLTNKFAGYGLQ